MSDSEKLDLILSKLDKMDVLENRIQAIEDDLKEVKQQVTNIDLTLENEIRVNIKHVAKGHSDLSRNLRDTLKINSENEMLIIRVNTLETELRKIKERLENIA